jgi:hypothetical protein
MISEPFETSLRTIRRTGATRHRGGENRGIVVTGPWSRQPTGAEAGNLADACAHEDPAEGRRVLIS